MSTPTTRHPALRATCRAGPPSPEPTSRTVIPGVRRRLGRSRSTASVPPAWNWSTWSRWSWVRSARAVPDRCPIEVTRSVSVYVIGRLRSGGDGDGLEAARLGGRLVGASGQQQRPGRAEQADAGGDDAGDVEAAHEGRVHPVEQLLL